MSELANDTALALHEILLSISDGINEAQNQLRNMPPYDQYGRPNPMYQLPYVDFSLELFSELNLQIQSPEGDPESKGIASMKSRQALIFKPVSPSSASNSTTKITSTISGRFVAIMPNEGMPQVFLTIRTYFTPSTEKHTLIAKMQMASGEPLVGQRVEVNYDRLKSNELNNEDTIGNVLFTLSKSGVTNAQGEFTTEFTIDEADPDHIFILVANSGTLLKSIAVTVTD